MRLSYGAVERVLAAQGASEKTSRAIDAPPAFGVVVNLA